MKYKRNLITTFALLIVGFFLLTMDIQVQATTIEEGPCQHTVVTDPAVAATCTTEGKTEGSHCSICNEVLTVQEVIWPLDHKYTTVIKKATPKKNGSVTVKCVNCGEKDIDKSYTIDRPEKILLNATQYEYTGKVQKFLYAVEDSKRDYISAKNYKASYKNNKKVGVATVTVTFKGKYYSGKMKKTCTIQPVGLNSLINGSTTMYSTNINWNKQDKQTSGYQLQYTTNKNFKGAKNIWVKNVKDTSKTIDGLKEDTKYYLRLRTYKNVKVNGKSQKIYSDWMNTLVTTRKYPTLNAHPTTPVKAGAYELYVMHLDDRGYPYYYSYGHIDEENTTKDMACHNERKRYLEELKMALGSRYVERYVESEKVGEYNGRGIWRWYLGTIFE